MQYLEGHDQGHQTMDPTGWRENYLRANQKTDKNNMNDFKGLEIVKFEYNCSDGRQPWINYFSAFSHSKPFFLWLIAFHVMKTTEYMIFQMLCKKVEVKENGHKNCLLQFSRFTCVSPTTNGKVVQLSEWDFCSWISFLLSPSWQTCLGRYPSSLLLVTLWLV